MELTNQPILGGVCLSYSEKSNINVWIIRALLIVVTIFSYVIPLAVLYLIFWISKQNNEKDTNEPKSEKVKRRLITTIAIIIGSVSGFFLGLLIGQLAGHTGGDSIMSVFYALLGIPIGGLTCFALVKNKLLK